MIRLGIVDDESLVRTTVKKLIPFDELGLELCFEADDGLEALELCRQFKPDILIADIRMPGLTGIELIQELKNVLPSVKTIIISGYRDFEYAKTAIKYGVYDYILKPVNSEELIETLSRIKSEVLNLRSQAEQEHSFRNRNSQASHAVLEKLMNKLIMKNTRLNSEILEELKEYGINFTNPFYSLILFSPDNTFCFENNDRKVEKLKNLMVRSVKKYMGEGVVFQTANSPYDLLILINHGGQQGLVPSKMMELISRLYQQKFLTSLSVSFSSQGQTIGSMDKMFEQCYTAIQMRFWEDDSNVLKQYAFDPKQFIENKPGVIEENMVEKLIFDIRFNHEETMGKHVNTVLQKVIGQNRQSMHPSSIKEYLWVVLQVVLEKLNIYTDFISYECLVLNKHPKQKLDAITSLKALNIYLGEILSRLCSFYNEKQSRLGAVSPIDTAKKIIQQNYEKDISLELISGYVHLSQAYFSDQFKKETGMSFTQYKALIKVENAKRLLKETNSSITQISSSVGFADSKYFSRMFKKITGMSPNEYREQL
ncbi:MAG: response regulator [Clostridia bacterium]|nr:response regulator [Clostridia bacterium]